MPNSPMAPAFSSSRREGTAGTIILRPANMKTP
jgi:hypothetical protein